MNEGVGGAAEMDSLIAVLIFVILWLILVRLVLPRLGVPT